MHSDSKYFQVIWKSFIRNDPHDKLNLEVYLQQFGSARDLTTLLIKSLFVSSVGLIISWLMSRVWLLRFWNQAVDKVKKKSDVSVPTEITLNLPVHCFDYVYCLLCHSFMYLIIFMLSFLFNRKRWDP